VANPGVPQEAQAVAHATSGTLQTEAGNISFAILFFPV